MANKRDTQHQQQTQQQQQQQQQNQSQKKPLSGEGKKLNEAEEAAAGSSVTAPSDVYEFVSTPKHSSCSSGSGDENPSKNSDKSSDDKSGTDSDTPPANQQQKRPVDQQDAADETSTAEEDAKRKKRKDSELRDGSKPQVGTNRVTSRVGQKPPGPASKTMGLVNKSTAVASNDRKSPSEVSEKSHDDDDAENDDSKDGPKVPPLKIVIPQQASGATEVQETQSVAQRASNKVAASRNHPYVIASSNSNDGTGSDKDGARGQSPSAESNKSDDTSKPSGKSKEPRILRSSRKDAKDDRGSNNSSPQLPASSTPSPATQNTESSAGNEPENQQISQNTTSTSTATSSNSTVTTVTSSIASVQSTSQVAQSQQNLVELHPRKRKIKASSREPTSSVASSVDTKDSNSKDGQEKTDPVHPHDQPFTNCYQMYIDLRKQIEQRHNNLHPVEPRPLKGLEDYLMNRRTYLLQGKNLMEPNIIIPPLLPPQMKETFIEQEKDRHKLKLRHIVEKEKMVLSKEQEILRVHCKAAQMIANQSQPFSVCTILKDEEVYNIITPEQEEKYRNKNRERSHGRVFYQALKELDDKYDKIKVMQFHPPPQQFVF